MELARKRGEATPGGLPLAIGGAREGVVAGLIVVCALGVRLLGARRGLPYIPEWDEPFVLAPVIKMLLFHTLNPGVFVYPSLFFYLLLPVVYAHALYLHAQGVMASINDIVLAHPLIPTGYVWYINAPSFYLWARVLTALLGAATVYLTYRIGRAAFGRRIGLIAAALFAVAPGAVYYADTVRVDVPVAFFTSAALLAGLGVLQRGRPRDYVIAGLLSGLAISTKQTAVWIVPALVVAHLLNPRRTAFADRAVALMAACLAAGVIVGTPYLLIRPDLVLAGSRQGVDAYGLLAPLRPGDFAYRLALNLAYFVRPMQGGDWYAVPHSGLGLLPGIAAAIGVVAGFRQQPGLQRYLLTFPVFLLLFLARSEAFYVRNLAPALPLAAVWAAVGAMWVWQRIAALGPLRRPSWRALGAVAGIVLLLGGPLRESWALASWLDRHQDTRTQAVEWLRRHVPRGAAVAFELELAWYLPALDHLPYRVAWTGRGTPASWYVQERIDYAVVGDRNPEHTRPPAAMFPRPWYLPSFNDESKFIPNSYPVIDPAIFIVRPQGP